MNYFRFEDREPDPKRSGILLVLDKFLHSCFHNRVLYEVNMGKLLAIYVCPEKGLPMSSIQQVRAIAGVGLEGDRYALGKGAYSRSARVTIRHVSLVSIEAINEANRELEFPFLPEETRRNLLTEGIDLNSLVGRMFQIHDVFMHGVELCTPCARPSTLAKKPGFEPAFQERGGLRAEILTTSVITVGNDIFVAN